MSVKDTTIPKIRKVYYDTYANLPTSGVSAGDLGYSTDRKVFYRWSGVAWQNVGLHFSSGAYADIPAAADLPNDSLYFATDKWVLYQNQSSTWVAITFYSSAGLAANIPSAADLPDGSLYFATDTSLLYQNQSSTWVQVAAVGLPDGTPSDSYIISNPPEVNSAVTTYTMVREIRMGNGGSYRIKFDLKAASGTGNVYGRIYRNGVAVGTERIDTGTSYVTMSEDIAGWSEGDLCQLYIKAAAGISVYASNFVIRGEQSYRWINYL